MKCRYCGLDFPNGAKFCENCGAAITDTTIAMNTGINNMDDIGMQDIGSSPTPGINSPNGGQNVQPGGYGENNYRQPGYGQNSYGGGQQGYNQYQGYNRSNNSFGYDQSFTGYNTGDGSPKYVGFGEAIKLYFKNFIDFNGRSTRSEFWFAVLFIYIIIFSLSFMVGFMSGLTGGMTDTTLRTYSNAISIIANLCMLSVAVRRLHDIGKQGTYVLLTFIPLVGRILLIVFCCQPSVGRNEWGYPARPKGYQ